MLLNHAIPNYKIVTVQFDSSKTTPRR